MTAARIVLLGALAAAAACAARSSAAARQLLHRVGERARDALLCRRAAVSRSSPAPQERHLLE